MILQSITTLLKNSKIKLLSIILLFNFDFELYSQTPTELGINEMKYWKLRGRLIGDENNRDSYNGFMTVGSDSGMSIPGASRHPTYGRSYFDFNPGEIINGAGCTAQEINNIPIFAQYTASGVLVTGYSPLIDPRDGKELLGELKFSDNSLIKLGNYISVLATEWALLHREGASTAETEKELYYALSAIDRLDLAGETLYGMTPDKNGFLMRCDVPTDFQLKGSGKNIDLVTSAIACNNDYISDCESVTLNHFSNSMSQDEVVGAMLGFAMIRKMMPFYASYSGVGLRQYIQEITTRMMNWMKVAAGTNWWIITDPKNHLPVCRGPLAVFNSFPLAKIAEYICGTPFQNFVSLNVGLPIWQIMKNTYAMNNYDVALMLGIPTSVQTTLGLNAYEYVNIPGNNSYSHNGAYNVSMFLKLLTCSKTAPRPYVPYLDFTGKWLINTVSQTYLKDIYEELGSVMTGYKPVLTENHWRQEFNKLTCGCNCAQGNNPISWKGCDNYHVNTSNAVTVPTNPWSTEDRWAFNREKGCDGSTLREFNGLDYMLAYNLYKLKYFSRGYDDRVRAYPHDKVFPYMRNNPLDNNNPIAIGSNLYPVEGKAVFSLTSWNTQINPQGSVTFTAGSDIKLLPGFQAKYNSVFKAQIKEYDCTPTTTPVTGGSIVAWKNGSDSFQNVFFEGSIDSIVDIQFDEDSIPEELPDYDSNVLVIRYSTNHDTIFFDLNPDYIFTDDGQIIYNPPDGNNKNALETATKNSINLYPNPSSGDVFIKYSLYTNSEIKIKITNEVGQNVEGVYKDVSLKQEPGNHKMMLHTNQLFSGIYFCIIEINGQKEIRKFTISK